MNSFRVSGVDSGADIIIEADTFEIHEGVIVLWKDRNRIACFPALNFFVTCEPDEPGTTTN